MVDKIKLIPYKKWILKTVNELEHSHNRFNGKSDFDRELWLKLRPYQIGFSQKSKSILEKPTIIIPKDCDFIATLPYRGFVDYTDYLGFYIEGIPDIALDTVNRLCFIQIFISDYQNHKDYNKVKTFYKNTLNSQKKAIITLLSTELNHTLTIELLKQYKAIGGKKEELPCEIEYHSLFEDIHSEPIKPKVDNFYTILIELKKIRNELEKKLPTLYKQGGSTKNEAMQMIGNIRTSEPQK